MLVKFLTTIAIHEGKIVTPAEIKINTEVSQQPVLTLWERLQYKDLTPVLSVITVDICEVPQAAQM